MERLFCVFVGFAISLVFLFVFLVAKELLEDHRVKTELRAKAIADRTGREIKQNLCHYHADFKKKWMGNRGVRVRRIVDEAIQRTKNELYETFNIEEDAENAKSD